MANSMSYVSFLMDGDDVVDCEVCLEPFNATSRPPKLLPCGHNFCENCLFSICCHQEYYLLDSINCPTCRAQFPTNVAKSAPTNYDLCKVLDKHSSRSANVTVIHVPDKQLGASSESASGQKHLTSFCALLKSTSSPASVQNAWNKSGRREKLTSQCRSLVEKSTGLKHLRCADCQRKITQKQLSRVARYCVPCSFSSNFTLACLECCVNAHNGHQLLTYAQLEANHLKGLCELRQLRQKVVDWSDSFDQRVAEIRQSRRLVCPMLVNDKQNLLTATLASLDDVIRRIESATLVFPQALSAFCNEHLHAYTRLSKLSSALEKSVECQNEPKASGSGCGGSSGGLRRSLSSRHSRVSLRGDDDRLWQQSVESLCALLTPSPLVLRLRELFSTISPRDTIEERKCKILACTAAIARLLENDISLSMVPIFADAFLNGFHYLHELSKKSGAQLRREHVWKHVQMSYTEMLRIAAKNYPAYHPERVDILDDLAYLCRLYADVCDEAIVTICVIEAARARAAESGLLSEEDRKRTDERLQLIDEHLVECRRMQKLQALRTTKSRKNPGGVKHLFSCFRHQRVHA